MTRQVVEVAHLDARPTSSPMMAGSVSNRAVTRKLRAANPWDRARARPRLPMPAMTTGHIPVEPELPVDLLDEEGGVVAGAAGAEGPQQRQVLAHLGRVDLGRGGQQLRRDGGGARTQQLLEDALVHGQAGHGGFGDPSALPRDQPGPGLLIGNGRGGVGWALPGS